MDRLITDAGILLGLHISQSHIAPGHPQKLPVSVIYRGNDTDHHNVFALKLVHIGLHNIYLAGGFYLLIILFVKIVKGILVLFKLYLRPILIKIRDGFISHIPLMYAVGLPVAIRNGVLLKIGKHCSKILVSQQNPL